MELLISCNNFIKQMRLIQTGLAVILKINGFTLTIRAD
jgi:hypothetical protein